MGNDQWLYGKAVVDGVPRFLSVSRLSGADEAEGGCLRAWFYEMVMGRKKPRTRATTRGDDTHEQLAKYLTTGERAFSSLTLTGMHMVPEPGPDLLVEHDMLIRPGESDPTNEAEAAIVLANAPLTADGIPVLGRMDLIHGRGTNKGGLNIEETQDPPNTVEVCDWKTTGNPNYIKRAKDLPNLIQMAGYAEWVYRVEPRTEQVRLSHGYFVERGGPSRKVTLRVIRDEVAKTWEHAEQVARSIRHAAAETDPDRVDANLKACDRYGGCFHRDVCKARMHQALTNFVGQSMADKLLGKQQETPTMGLLDKMKASATPTPMGPSSGLAGMISAATPAAAPGLAGLIGTTPPAAPAPDPAAQAVAAAAERAKLEAEEAAMRAAAQLRAAADKLKPYVDKFEAFAKANTDMGLGTPKFVGDLAAVYTALKNAPATGSGTLGEKVEIADFATAETISSQLDQLVAAGQIKAPAVENPLAGLGGLLSPETPPPTVPTRTAHDTGLVTGVNVTEPNTQQAATTIGLPPPANPPGTVNTAPTNPPPAEDKKPDDKKPKTPSKKKSTGALSGITLIVDGFAEIPDATIESFHPIFDAFCAELAAIASDLDLRAAGLRSAPEGKLIFAKDDSPMAFGRGDGALAALFREREIAAGVYYFSTRGNRLAEVAADAMRDKCRKSGGAFFWGGR